MTDFYRAAILAGVAAATATGAFAQRDFADVEIETTKLADGVYMLVGAGGNIGLSVGEDGAFVIDDQFAPLSDKIAAAIDKVSDNAVEFVINTHWHGDHTGGNEAMGEAGAHIVAHENVRTRLKNGLKTETRDTPPAPEAALPVITFTDETTFHWNGEEIEVRHHHAGHTDGDAIIHFKNANVVHMGDVFFHGNFPYIDLDSGGDLDGYIAMQEAVHEMIDEETKIIPGHGPLAMKADLEENIEMLKDVRNRVQKLIDDGKSEEEAIAAKPLADLNETWGQGFINGDQLTTFAYRSLTAAE